MQVQKCSLHFTQLFAIFFLNPVCLVVPRSDLYSFLFVSLFACVAFRISFLHAFSVSHACFFRRCIFHLLFFHDFFSLQDVNILEDVQFDSTNVPTYIHLHTHLCTYHHLPPCQAAYKGTLHTCECIYICRCLRFKCMYYKWWFQYWMAHFPASWLANGYHGRLGGSGISIWVDMAWCF